VQEANCHQLKKLTGEAHRYIAIDSGDLAIVEKLCLFPQTLDLKVGARVILLKNMTEKLVNGSAGIVESFVKDQGGSISYPSVRFDNGMIQTIWPEAWENEDRHGLILARRMQLPLDLAWALSIHKSQGMTIEYVVIDCAQIFAAGQLYVGVSRAKSPNGLQVLNFSRTKCIVDTAVTAFYEGLDS
ncbi:P-loop containing nucleoside triphosphate hydrolase protein, partial [Jimgerdemannia flammicorona]